MARTNEPLLSALGERISLQRKKRGITLDQLASKMSISKGNLSDIERGKRDPRYSTLLAISQGLHMHVCDLLQLRGIRRSRSA
jgi:transcriptional regulator with XRE-family HTH domain